MPELPAPAAPAADSGGAELNAPGLRIGPPARRPGTPHPRVPGQRVGSDHSESCLPGAGQPDG